MALRDVAVNCAVDRTTMALKAGAQRSVGRQRWLVVVAGGFALYCMFLFQMRLWSAASHADLRANVISAERDPAVIDRPTVKQDERPQHDTRQDTEVTQQPFNVQVEETMNQQQSLRTVDPPLSTPGAVVILTPKLSTMTGFGVPAVPIATTQAPPSLADRHKIVSGYDATMKFLASYRVPEGSDEQLFLLFVCGDERGEQKSWRRVCVDAADLVYDVFAKSPSRNKLLTIHAGSKKDWSAANAFFKDGDLKVKMIPALMQWHGGHPGAKRATSGMIIEESILYEPLLRYLFKNEDILDPLLAPEKIASKEIVVLKGYKNYRRYIDSIAAGENPSLIAPEGPMFLFLIAGRLGNNDRLWCPYCRYSEISVEYAFKAFAPPGSRLVKVETVNSYATWKSPANDWKGDTALMVRGVPWMYRANLDKETRSFNFERVSERFDHPDALRGIFQGWKNPV